MVELEEGHGSQMAWIAWIVWVADGMDGIDSMDCCHSKELIHSEMRTIPS
jgi:hypothetical protein